MQEELQKLITEGRLGDVLKKLHTLLQEDDKDEAILLQSRYNKLERDTRLGVLSQSNADIKRARITQAALHLIGKVPDDATSSDQEKVSTESPPSSPPSDPPESTQQDSKTRSIKTIRIFLASSSELAEDRKAFREFLSVENDLLHKKGVYLEMLQWEYGIDAISETRTQDEYNEKVKESDIVVCLFYKKAGQWTIEEFETAHRHFLETGRPLIYTYFKQLDDKDQMPDELIDFQKRLSELGHFYTIYENIDQLKYKFKKQLDYLSERDFFEEIDQTLTEAQQRFQLQRQKKERLWKQQIFKYLERIRTGRTISEMKNAMEFKGRGFRFKTSILEKILLELKDEEKVREQERLERESLWFPSDESGSNMHYGTGDIISGDKIERQINIQQGNYIENASGPGGGNPIPLGTKKSILFVAADPSDETKLNTPEEHRTVKEEMQKGDHRDLYSFLPVQLAARITQIQRAFEDDPSIIHFAGHGIEEGIIIKGNDGTGIVLPDRAIQRLFKNRPEMELVLLNSCYSAHQAELISQFGLLVIGHNLPILDKAAISFAKGFYLGLSEGMEYYEAFNAGMIVIETEYPDHAGSVEVWSNGQKLDW